MENLQTILSLAGTSLGLLITALTFLIKFIKNVKARKTAEQVIKIGNAVMPFIRQAESFTHYSGAEKKEFVLTKANRYAIDNGVAFDVEAVSTKIEELVALSKQINVRDKDKYVCNSLIK